MTLGLPAIRSFAERQHEARNHTYGVSPYVKHLDHVAFVLRAFGHDDYRSQAAAYLHDVVEDCEVPLETIERIAGPEVARIVDAVTGRGANRKERNASSYAKVRVTPGAIQVKLADRLANTLAARDDDTDLNESRRAMYQKELPEFKRALFVEGEEDRMWRALEIWTG